MEILGKIKVINPEQQVSATFKKRELVVTTEDQYPQHILIEFSQDKCDLLNNFKVGQNVNVGINLRGRSWLNPQGEEKFFNSIQGWKIFEDAAGALSPQPGGVPQNNPKQVASGEDEPDGLPF
jgi:hypothetical protein